MQLWLCSSTRPAAPRLFAQEKKADVAHGILVRTLSLLNFILVVAHKNVELVQLTSSTFHASGVDNRRVGDTRAGGDPAGGVGDGPVARSQPSGLCLSQRTKALRIASGYCDSAGAPLGERGSCGSRHLVGVRCSAAGKTAAAVLEDSGIAVGPGVVAPLFASGEGEAGQTVAAVTGTVAGAVGEVEGPGPEFRPLSPIQCAP